MPFPGVRFVSSSLVGNQGYGYYWSSKHKMSAIVYYFRFRSELVEPQVEYNLAY